MKKTKREAKATSLFLQKTIKKLLQKGRASVANSSARLKKNLVLPAAKGPGAKASICEREGISKYAELFLDQRNEKTFFMRQLHTHMPYGRGDTLARFSYT